MLEMFVLIEDMDEKDNKLPQTNKQFVVEADFSSCGNTIIKCVVDLFKNKTTINIKIEFKLDPRVKLEIYAEIGSLQTRNNRKEIHFSILPERYTEPLQQLLHNYCDKQPNTMV